MLATRLIESLSMSPDKVLFVADKFKKALVGGPSACGLKLIDSTFKKPSGHEQGEVLVLDFGGTNLRLLLVELKGNRDYRIVNQHVANLRQPHSGIDLTSESAGAEDLFDYIAGEVEHFIDAGRNYQLGQSFSFPTRQINSNSAILLEWTKEIKTRSAVGRDINGLLRDALQRRRITNVTVKAILNDAVGTLLAAAYKCGPADVGSICGTGHNSCYLDSSGRLINIESGNFFNAVLPVTKFDRLLDRSSINPGKQRLEKMVAGAYLGELFRLTMLDMAQDAPVSEGSKRLIEKLTTHSCIDAQDISLLLEQKTFAIGGAHYALSARELSAAEEIARSLVERSARLVTATYLGIIGFLDPHRQRRHVITIDGSLYEKMPGFAASIRNTLKDVCSQHIELHSGKDYSGIGAAVAAVMQE